MFKCSAHGGNIRLGTLKSYEMYQMRHHYKVFGLELNFCPEYIVFVIPTDSNTA